MAGARHSGTAERNADIVCRFRAGETLQAIGDRYGVTRERVRQITIRYGAEARRVTQGRAAAARLEKIRAALAGGATARETGESLGINQANLWRIMNDAGIKPRWPTAMQRSDDTILEGIAAQVRRGMSIKKACGGSRSLMERMRVKLRQMGVESTHGKWVSPEHRRAIIEQGLAEHLPWKVIAHRISIKEGRECLIASAQMWARSRGMIAKRKSRAAKPIKAVKPAKPAKPRLDPVVTNDIRKSCVANYGRCSASALAKTLGITRNAVTGHWFRARKAGQITGGQA